MTVLLAAERLTDLEERLVITQETVDALAARDASMADFPVGEGIRVIDLLYGAFMPSGADGKRDACHQNCRKRAGLCGAYEPKGRRNRHEKYKFRKRNGPS